jgi:GTP-binding protein
MSPRELSARRSALARASGQTVHVISGVTGQGVPEMLRHLQNAITAHRADLRKKEGLF